MHEHLCLILLKSCLMVEAASIYRVDPRLLNLESPRQLIGDLGKEV